LNKVLYIWILKFITVPLLLPLTLTYYSKKHLSIVLLPMNQETEIIH